MRAFPLLFLLAACGPFPRDTAGTSERVTTEHSFRVAGDVEHPLVTALADRMAARAVPIPLHGEPALQALESGGVDLVVARFDPASPWTTRVGIGEPLDSVGSAAAVRNGENRWAGEVDATARTLPR